MMTMSGDKYNVFSSSIIGYSHIKNSKVCQDYSYSSNDENKCYIIVADGHGGDEYFRSDRGSKFVVEAAKECIEELYKLPRKAVIDKINKEPKKVILQLGKSIISLWNDKVYEDYTSNPFLAEEIELLSDKLKNEIVCKKRMEVPYGTTFIMAFKFDETFILMQIGDGSIVLINNEEKAIHPMEEDKKCFLNATTSLCDTNVIESLRYETYKEPIKAIFIGTDGIEDSFLNDNQVEDFYLTMLATFMKSGFKKGIKEVLDFLPKLSEKGSRDDISLGVIVIDDESKGFMAKIKNNLGDIKNFISRDRK